MIATDIEAHCGHRRLAMGWAVVQAVAAAHQIVADKGLPKAGLSERSWKDWEPASCSAPTIRTCSAVCSPPVRSS
ncbi:hypothetical protein EKH77_00090 [Streptomyces luteoverticillatus]|uniref:Uncharacterized protein n=1 Tax=Streptomyces luteoverticillatus TaxID=66425 RepID=A0A3Q9FTD3_STRLT|nr:hypothetical protein [Streptomyces luteoverticillatus]AZQ69836.1 hypothetical protein EKH77_00090 [Streptomyces luteoverticillatus]